MLCISKILQLCVAKARNISDDLVGKVLQFEFILLEYFLPLLYVIVLVCAFWVSNCCIVVEITLCSSLNFGSSLCYVCTLISVNLYMSAIIMPLVKSSLHWIYSNNMLLYALCIKHYKWCWGVPSPSLLGKEVHRLGALHDVLHDALSFNSIGSKVIKTVGWVHRPYQHLYTAK